jgi:hypothetical protein
VSQYITTQREKYAPRSVQLSAQQKAAMNGFFSPQVLDGTNAVKSVIEKFREKYGAKDVKKHYSRFGVAVSVKLN